MTSNLLSLVEMLNGAVLDKNVSKTQIIIEKLESIMRKESGGDYSFFPICEALHSQISCLSEQDNSALSTIFRDAFKRRGKYKRRGIDRYPSNKDYFDFGDFNQLVRTSMRLHYFNERFPTSKFSPKSKVFTFGSCFAVNIHKYLRSRNINSGCVPMLESLNSPRFNLKYLQSSYKYDSRFIGFLSSDSDLNKFSVEARGKIEPPYLNKDNTWFTTRDSDRGAILKKSVRNADLIVFTVGTAIKPVKKRTDDCLETVESQKSAIKQVVTEILKLNSKVHIVLTLSPIPIELVVNWDQYSSAVEADCVQKSISRIALHDLFSSDFRGLQKISYFPSFEIVRWLSPLSAAFNPGWVDFHHPDPRIIEVIAGIFESVYFKANQINDMGQANSR